MNETQKTIVATVATVVAINVAIHGIKKVTAIAKQRRAGLPAGPYIETTTPEN